MNGEAMLELLRARRTVRAFQERPIPRPVLERLMQAATSAPSATNRQPWRFAVVTSEGMRRDVAQAARRRTEEMKEIIRRGHHAEDLGAYLDYFWEPLERAAAIVVPQYRVFPDLLAGLIESAGGSHEEFATSGAMQVELCATSAAVMALLVQAHSEGLGACWMSGPMVAVEEIGRLLGIAPPWRMLGAVALGWPAAPTEAKPRKPLSVVVQWFEDGAAEDKEPR